MGGEFRCARRGLPGGALVGTHWQGPTPLPPSPPDVTQTPSLAASRQTHSQIIRSSSSAGERARDSGAHARTHTHPHDMALRRLTAFLIAIGFLPSIVLSKADWDYEKNGQKGPGNWPGMCKTGYRQSPIDIVTRHAFPVKFKELQFHRYDLELHKNMATVRDNGHAIALELGSLRNRSAATVRDGGLESVYLLDHVHFHAPSEHTLNGRRYPLEAHLVHHDHLASSVSQATKLRDGIAVLGVLFHLSEEPNLHLEDMIEGLRRLENSESDRVKLPESGAVSMGLEDLLPHDKDDFFRYYGSLTTPQCDEAVVWTVFRETIPISEEQLKLLREHHPNFRPAQDINQRYVLHNKGDAWSGSTLAAPYSPIILALSSLIASYAFRR